MELVSVAALSENRVIGRDGEIPWESLPEDREQYRSRIAEDPVILGRRTFDSMREELPGRAQIVLSRRNQQFDVPTATHAATVDDALDKARGFDAQTAYVLGGGEIYSLFQPRLDRMVLSRVPGTYEGDSYYPEWNDSEWTLDSESEYDGFVLQSWSRVERDADSPD